MVHRQQEEQRGERCPTGSKRNREVRGGPQAARGTERGEVAHRQQEGQRGERWPTGSKRNREVRGGPQTARGTERERGIEKQAFIHS